MISMLTQTLKKIGKKLIIAIIWLGIWQTMSAIVGLSAHISTDTFTLDKLKNLIFSEEIWYSILLPSPVTTLSELIKLAVTADFWIAVLFSVIRITIGFTAGTLAGVLTGAISSFLKGFSDFLSPLVSIIKATPVASFIILAVIWLKTGNIPSFATALIVFPFVYSNIKTGFQETDRHLIEMSDAFGVSFGRKLLMLYIPSVKPYFISAATTAMGLAWKAGIAAEVICNPTMSIGNGIYESKVYFEPTQMFAWTTVVIILSIILEKTMLLILRKEKENDKA